MRYLGWLFPAFFIAEIISIVLVSQWLGGWTLVLMALQFFAGLFLLRNLGFSNVLVVGETLRNKQQGLSLYQLMWPIRFILAGLLLLSPGFVSTVFAAGLMLPIKAGPKTGITAAHTQQAYQAYKQQRKHSDGDIIECEFDEVKPDIKRAERIEP